jgi:polar amino acid transport system ATP-binding protein
MTDASAMLAASGVHKRYGQDEVLRGVDLEVGRGEVKVILGPSGSGKSTLLRCLALLEPVDAGELYLEGERLGVKRKRGKLVPAPDRDLCSHRSELGMVFQRFNLFPHLTAVQNAMVGLVEVRGLAKQEAREQALALLDRVGLSDRVNAYPSELSGGQQQRVAIARALVMHPKVMLFDEPTSALDAELVREVLDVIERLAEGGMTMVVVTHELGFARRVADRVAMMDEGILVEEADPDSFFESPQHKRSRSFLEAIGGVDGH